MIRRLEPPEGICVGRVCIALCLGDAVRYCCEILGLQENSIVRDAAWETVIQSCS